MNVYFFVNWCPEPIYIIIAQPIGFVYPILAKILLLNVVQKPCRKVQFSVKMEVIVRAVFDAVFAACTYFGNS